MTSQSPQKSPDQILFEKYPNLFKLFLLSHQFAETKDESLKSLFMDRLVWPRISCGSGWFNIIDGLSTVLEALILEQPEEERDKYAAVQVKEKFGGLRFYLGHQTEDMATAIEAAEALSLKTCEVCGEAGERVQYNRVETLCSKHALVSRSGYLWGHAYPGRRETVFKGKHGPNTTEETLYTNLIPTLQAQQEKDPSMEREVLFENQWVSLVKLDGWCVAAEQTRCKGGALVAVLGYRKSDDPAGVEYVGRFEWCPAHSNTKEHELSSITGGVDTDDIEMDALRELAEEAGIFKSKSDLIYLGTCNPIKSDCATMYLFAVECEEIGESHGDGSHSKHGAFCKWVSEDIMVACKDPYVHTMMLRLKGLLD